MTTMTAQTVRVYLTADPSRVTERPVLIAAGRARACRRAAAQHLGCASLRGLAQAATERGVRYYAAGATDDDGASVEIVY